MLPRGRAREEAGEADREFVADLAESFYPDVEHIDQLNKDQLQFWIPFATSVLRGDQMDRLVAKFGDALAPGVDAQIDDILKRQQFDFANERQRIVFDGLERIQKKRRRDQRREEERQKHLQEISIAADQWEVEKKERLSHLGIRAWRERIVLGMAIVGFLLVVATCVLGLLSHQTYLASGSGGGVALIILGVVFHQVRQDQKAGDGRHGPGEAA